MKAVGIYRWGGPEVLKLVELPVPSPGPGEVRIRVKGATVNPADILFRVGLRAAAIGDRPPPWVPGMDAAGVVDAVGDGAAWLAGEAVMAIVLPFGPHGGAYAEQLVVPADSIASIPAGASFVEAATLPMNGLTAQLVLDVLGLRPGQTLAITGSPGALGGYVMQLAKHAGLWVVADASPGDAELVRALGADSIVARGDDYAARIRHLHPGGVDGLVDTARIGRDIVAAVRDGGSFVSVQPFEHEPHREITFHNVRVSSYAHETGKLDALRALVEDGAVTLRVAATYPLADAAKTQRRFEGGGVRGRLVLEP